VIQRRRIAALMSEVEEIARKLKQLLITVKRKVHDEQEMAASSDNSTTNLTCRDVAVLGMRGAERQRRG
jgi:hypothetical protein